MATTTPRRRRTTRRPARRSSRKRRQDAMLVGAGLGAILLVTAIRWCTQHLLVTSLAGLAISVMGVWWLARVVHGRIRARQARWLAPTDIRAYMTATPDQFEQQTAALCKRDGARNVRVVGGAGDLAADVLATTPDGRKLLIQCKRYAPHNAVGSDHVQRVNGTYRDIHGCEKAVIVTTSSYTRDARNLANRVGITLLDADGLAAWARGGQPPWH